ncbi:ROK family protein [Fulvivirga sp. M361]|uniref:ROK family protein n=1 Tax=Fulvivirga sp. M361 TaxID=2594266 RepID=UPI00117BB62A|nr:ROK family protein [Fulvivirga sp. M361]TRX59598.1 ROK family protein [Fulvivirga sp. M361]
MSDQRSATVLTLDAGGTNFVFSVIRDFKELTSPITLPAQAENLAQCLSAIISGFEQIAGRVKSFDAISFAFPGPADYVLGIIGNLPNFKAFRGGVPLGPMLENYFNVPVFINNDGNLFASGVAHAGYLPALNARLTEEGSDKRFHHLIGITLGTGFGCGIVSNGQLITGDNSCGAEIHNTLSPVNKNWNAEESISTRAIQRVYTERSGIPFNTKLMPKDIYNIAKGNKGGNITAAREAFIQYGTALGASIVNVLALIDGIVVIGGGLSASWELFAPSMFKEINRNVENFKGEQSNKLSYKVFNLEDPSTFNEFARGKTVDLPVPRTDKFIKYDTMPRTGIALSKLGASRAIALGAYALALQKLEVYA